MNKILLTGIDTEVGKTVVSAILVRALHGEYWKPIQAGELEFTDTDKVRQWTRDLYIYHEEAFRLNSPMSPHAAADIDQVQIKGKDILTFPEHDKTLIVEGAGGIMVPVNHSNEYIVPLLAPETDAIVLVTKNYLGSINHTLLSIAALRQYKKPIYIIFNGKEHITNQEAIEEYLNENESIIAHIPEVEFVNADWIDQVAQRIEVSKLEA